MNEPCVYIVDDDPGVLDALHTLVDSVGLSVVCCKSANEFLTAYTDSAPSCLITDICLPGMDGMQLQQHLKEYNINLPLIAISAHGDIAMAVEMVRRGAIDFIEKPFRNHVILKRIHEALDYDAERRKEETEHNTIKKSLCTLTPRENDILALLLTGLSNKVIAKELNLSPRTVETHRANILKKMNVDSVTNLVKVMSSHSN